MKKYVIVSLLILPLTAFGAPSVRKLGVGGAVSGTSAAVAAPKAAVPAKATSTVSTGSNAARVGSLRARATTAGLSGAMTSSTARFPVIMPTRIYNSANSPKPTSGGTSSIGSTGLSCPGIDCDTLNEMKEQIENNTTVINEHTEQISNNTDNITNNTTNISANTESIENLQNDPRFNSIRRGGADKPADFTASLDSTTDPRAWIWVEE